MLALISPLFLILLFLGFPIFLTMGITSGIVFAHDGSLVPLAQKVIDELNSTTFWPCLTSLLQQPSWNEAV